MIEAATTDRTRATSPGTVATVAAYGVLSAILVGTRLVGLKRSFWHDEIVAVVEYVRPGVREIVSGGVNHELFTLLEWATSSLIGESEAAFRLWSVVPFILGVGVVTAWLHRRLDPLSGVLFLFFATVSPLLLDITPQARGYGIAFLAMGVLIVAALEALRTPRTLAVVAFCLAGLAGTWTLPNFAIAFVATGSVLIVNRELRRRVAVGLSISTLAIAAWYLPHLGAVAESSQVEYGVRISPLGVLTASIDQTLIPSLLWIDGTVLIAGFVWIPLVALALVFMGSSPLLHRRWTASVLVVGVVATVVVFWAMRLFVVPRYLSFLLVPLYMLLASGMASILRSPRSRPAILRTSLVLTALALVSVNFARVASDVTRLPREAHRDAAELVARLASPGTGVVVYAHRPEDVAFYLDGPVMAPDAPEVASAVCNAGQPVAYVQQPFVVRPVNVPCLERRAARHYRVAQYARGNRIDVWFVPGR